MSKQSFVFWQRIVSPHQAGLARELADAGCQVHYVAEKSMSQVRKAQGWAAPDLGSVDVQFVPDERALPSIIDAMPPDAIHLCQGLARNGMPNRAAGILRRRGARVGAMLETVDDRGRVKGPLKCAWYSSLAWQLGTQTDFLLATGHRTPQWLEERGFDARRIFPFTYFLPDLASSAPLSPMAYGHGGRVPRIGFVGRVDESKRLDILIEALALIGQRDAVLVVIGAGVLEVEMRALAQTRLGRERVEWIGQRSMEEARRLMSTLDLLVLPSDYDGWGAVVSEALLAGVPAICSDACGSAEAVTASGVGGVFEAGSVSGCAAVIDAWLSSPEHHSLDRDALRRWARSFSSVSGARYLRAICDHVYGVGQRPLPPWRAARVPVSQPSVIAVGASVG